MSANDKNELKITRSKVVRAQTCLLMGFLRLVILCDIQKFLNINLNLPTLITRKRFTWDFLQFQNVFVKF